MTTTVAVLLVFTIAAYAIGRQRALALAGGQRRSLHSMPRYHGLFVAACVFLPAAALLHLAIVIDAALAPTWIHAFHPEVLERGEDPALVIARIDALARGGREIGAIAAAERAAAEGLRRGITGSRWALGLGVLAVAIGGGALALSGLRSDFRARNRTEQIARSLLLACSLVAIATTVGIVLSLLAESLRFFAAVSPAEFFFGLEWSPREAIREDQIGSSGAFGVVPVLAGTLLITAIAMAVAGPIGLLSAIYMVEFADDRVRGAIKPVLEILAGVPTVVYGFFAAVTVAPFVRDVGTQLGFETSAQSALAAGTVMGMMIVPFMSSLADDVIGAVPRRLREGAYSLGATRGETVMRVVLPAALPGLLSATVLAVGRALGETMIVVMAAGLYARLTANPFDAVTTVTVQITTVLTGDQEFDSATTLSAFALALTLFVLTFGLNLFALRVMQRYRERYD